jgi:exodeoxyribonuclease III
MKVRLEQLLVWLEANQVDVLAMQEKKCIDANFPRDVFAEIEYQVNFLGQKTYNGVAIVNRQEQHTLTDIQTLEDLQRGILISTVNDYRIVNLYVLNDNEVGNDKYEYKLGWLSKATKYLQMMLSSSPQLILLGDINIAPKDIDVHDSEKWQGSVLVSEAERKAFSELLACGLTDSSYFSE